nr:transposase [Streptomyces sp. 8L]
MKKYFAGQGLSTYTHVSDQHSTFGTKVIVATRREARYVLDEIMGNKTDLPITEHATDTHGVTLVNLALFDLVGMQLSPRRSGPGEDHPVPDGPAARRQQALAGRRSAADPEDQYGVDRGEMGRSAASGRIDQVRARHCLADRRTRRSWSSTC